MYIIPIDTGTVTVSSHMARNAGGYHQGLDLVSDSGPAPNVLAAERGTVTQADFDPDGYGHYVIVQHSPREFTLYGHMATQPMVAAGQQVAQRDPLGVMGSTGSSTGRHVHFEIVVPPTKNNFWSAAPRWQYKKNPFLEVADFNTAQFGGQAEQERQARRWIDAIVGGPAAGLSRAQVIDLMVTSGTLAGGLVPLVS